MAASRASSGIAELVSHRYSVWPGRLGRGSAGSAGSLFLRRWLVDLTEVAEVRQEYRTHPGGDRLPAVL